MHAHVISIVSMRSMHDCANLKKKIIVKVHCVDLVLIFRIKSEDKTIQDYYNFSHRKTQYSSAHCIRKAVLHVWISKTLHSDTGEFKNKNL